MNFGDCIEFAQENKVCCVATTQDDQPRVRVMSLWRAQADGFYFCGLAPKNIYKQLRDNPKVEVCFYNNLGVSEGAKVMRVTGKVEFLDDLELKKQVLEDRSKYKNYGTGEPDDPTYPVFRIAHGEAWFWSREYILKESEAERIRF